MQIDGDGLMTIDEAFFQVTQEAMLLTEFAEIKKPIRWYYSPQSSKTITVSVTDFAFQKLEELLRHKQKEEVDKQLSYVISQKPIDELFSPYQIPEDPLQVRPLFWVVLYLTTWLSGCAVLP